MKKNHEWIIIYQVVDQNHDERLQSMVYEQDNERLDIDDLEDKVQDYQGTPSVYGYTSIVSIYKNK